MGKIKEAGGPARCGAGAAIGRGSFRRATKASGSQEKRTEGQKNRSSSPRPVQRTNGSRHDGVREGLQRVRSGMMWYGCGRGRGTALVG